MSVSAMHRNHCIRMELGILVALGCTQLCLGKCHSSFYNSPSCMPHNHRYNDLLFPNKSSVRLHLHKLFSVKIKEKNKMKYQDEQKYLLCDNTLQLIFLLTRIWIRLTMGHSTL